MKKEILGVKIDDVSQEMAIEKITRWMADDVFGKLVFTTGPEFLVTSRRDTEFRKILNAGDLNIPDGRGLQIFGGIKNRVPGVDLMLDLCREAAKNKWTVGLLGGQEGVARGTKEALEKKFPGIKIKYAISNYKLPIIMPVDFLFVALGHPKQEKFLWNCKLKIENCKFRVGMGVGGSFDYISGRIKRAPEWVRKIGGEWLFRLWQEPGRFWRIIKATVIYPFDILLNGLMGTKHYCF